MGLLHGDYAMCLEKDLRPADRGHSHVDFATTSLLEFAALQGELEKLGPVAQLVRAEDS